MGAAVMVGGAAVTDLAGEAEDTLLSVVVVTDSVVVTHLADSPGAVQSWIQRDAGIFSAFSGRGDHGRFGDRGFRGRESRLSGRRFRDFDGDSFDFGFYGFGYPDYYPYNYPYYYAYPYYNYDAY